MRSGEKLRHRAPRSHKVCRALTSWKLLRNGQTTPPGEGLRRPCRLGHPPKTPSAAASPGSASPPQARFPPAFAQQPAPLPSAMFCPGLLTNPRSTGGLQSAEVFDALPQPGPLSAQNSHPGASRELQGWALARGPRIRFYFPQPASACGSITAALGSSAPPACGPPLRVRSDPRCCLQEDKSSSSGPAGMVHDPRSGRCLTTLQTLPAS